jgi:protein TonB
VWASPTHAPQVTAAPAAARRVAHDPAAAMKACSEKAPASGSMGGNLRQPSKLVDVKPRYPQELADAGTGGVFVFAALIGTDGTIRDLQMTSGSNADLELAAANAIRQWEFTPTLLNCVAVEVPMTITVSFKPAP